MRKVSGLIPHGVQDKKEKKSARSLGNMGEKKTGNRGGREEVTHTRKITKPIGKKTQRSTVVDQEKWVVNISKRDLTPVEITALRKGLNFSITPNKVPVSKILSSIETVFTI